MSPSPTRLQRGYSGSMPTVRTQRLTRQIHLWFGLVIGVQVLVWVISGLVMVARPIEEVRGTDLRRAAPALLLPRGEGALARATAGLTTIERIELANVLGRPAWRITAGGTVRLADAGSGAAWTLTTRDAAEIARRATMLTGTPVITTIDPAKPPLELRRDMPGWQLDYPDGTHVLISATGEILALRTPWWRTYDWFWGLHILDPMGRETAHGPVIIIASILALGTVLTGLVLTVWHFTRRQR